MRTIVFGATGMVGQGVLRECLLDPEVECVLVVGRAPTGRRHEKLREIIHADFLDFSPIEDRLAGYDACFFCLGVSSVGMTEADYTRVTYGFTMAAASVLARRNPGMTFVYVSGAWADASESGRAMWARVKGRTENALLAMPFRSAVMFRPAYIQPLHGITSRTRLFRALYAAMAPLYPVWKAVLPKYVTTTEQLARAMIEAAKHGAPARVIESGMLAALASSR